MRGGGEAGGGPSYAHRSLGAGREGKQEKRRKIRQADKLHRARWSRTVLRGWFEGMRAWKQSKMSQVAGMISSPELASAFHRDVSAWNLPWDGWDGPKMFLNAAAFAQSRRPGSTSSTLC